MNLAPIVLFVYNRPWHTQQTIEALQKNNLADESELFIYSDEAKNEDTQKSVDEVRNYVDRIDGFKKVTIIKREKNWGLANSIIDGVTKIVNEYGKIIVLEDDLMTSPYFLRFMNESLDMYEKHTQVASIHGYIYPIDDLPDTFFIKGADCWGWATWKRAWNIFEPNGQKLLDELQSKKLENEVDFNGTYLYTNMLKDQIIGKNNSWAIRWYISAFLNNMLTLYPGQSYVQNIGFGEEGTHCTSETDIFDVKLVDKYSIKFITNIKENLKSRKKFEKYFNSIKGPFYKRVLVKIFKIIGIYNLIKGLK